MRNFRNLVFDAHIWAVLSNEVLLKPWMRLHEYIPYLRIAPGHVQRKTNASPFDLRRQIDTHHRAS